jgi:hypothetical protein
VSGQGISLDLGFIVQRSKDLARYEKILGLNGETAYLLPADHKTDKLFGIATVGKAPPLAWMNRWLTQYRPSQVPCRYACMYGGGELSNNGDVQKLLTHNGYTLRPTAPDLSFQNAPGERPHQDIGAGLQVMLRGANLENEFWPFDFNYSLQISNVLPHGDLGVPFERFTGQRASVNKYSTFRCLVIVKPPDKRNGKLEVNFRRGFFLGFTGTLSQIYYWDLASQRVKRAYTVKYDEFSTVMERPSPNSRHLCDAIDDKELPVDTQETSAPAAFDLASRASPFIRLKELELQIRCEHLTFGIEDVDCADLTRAYISDRTPHNTGAALRVWCRNYDGAYIVELDEHPVFNSADFAHACTLVRAALLAHAKTTLKLTLAPERKEPVRYPGCSPHIHIDQLHPVILTLFEMQEGRSITLDEMPDYEDIVDVIRAVTPLDDIGIESGPGPDLGNKPAIEYEEGTLPLKLLPLPQPPVRAHTDAWTNPSAQRATQLSCVLARVYAVSIQNQITTTGP